MLLGVSQQASLQRAIPYIPLTHNPSTVTGVAIVDNPNRNQDVSSLRIGKSVAVAVPEKEIQNSLSKE